MVKQPPPSIRLCPEHLCEIFWTEQLLSRIESGEWIEEIGDKSSDERTFQPFTDYNGNWIVETQEVYWKEKLTGNERARLHRYITDKGTVGGSGYPDPKRIKLDDGSG